MRLEFLWLSYFNQWCTRWYCVRFIGIMSFYSLHFYVPQDFLYHSFIPASCRHDLYYNTITWQMHHFHSFGSEQFIQNMIHNKQYPANTHYLSFVLYTQNKNKNKNQYKLQWFYTTHYMICASICLMHFCHTQMDGIGSHLFKCVQCV